MPLPHPGHRQRLGENLDACGPRRKFTRVRAVRDQGLEQADRVGRARRRLPVGRRVGAWRRDRGGRIDFRISRTDALPKIRHAVALLGVPGEVGSWLAARGVACRRFDQLGGEENAVVLVGDAPNSPDRAGVWEELARRMARGSVVVFLKPSAFSDVGDGVRWLPLARKGRCRESHNWVYHREDIAKPHPVFEGMAAGGIMDWYCYLQVTPQSLFDGQDPPEEVLAAAICPRRRAGGQRRGVPLRRDHSKLPFRHRTFHYQHASHS